MSRKQSLSFQFFVTTKRQQNLHRPWQNVTKCDKTSRNASICDKNVTKSEPRRQNCDKARQSVTKYIKLWHLSWRHTQKVTEAAHRAEPTSVTICVTSRLSRCNQSNVTAFHQVICVKLLFFLMSFRSCSGVYKKHSADWLITPWFTPQDRDGRCEASETIWLLKIMSAYLIKCWKLPFLFGGCVRSHI